MKTSDRQRERPLRPGDVVVVRSPAEILATLDASAAIDHMPFMPEMTRFAGQRFTVSRRVDKICDTIAYTGSRRLTDTVYLEDLRCDGSAHGGCQAGCKLYWKEAWLRRVDADGATGGATGHEPAKQEDELDRVATAGARTVRELDGVSTEVWRCKATDALQASVHLRGFDVRQYWRELTNGNYHPIEFIRILIGGFIIELGVRLRLIKRLPLSGPGTRGTRQSPIQAGELVSVRRPREIAQTLDSIGLDRGLSFDREMLPFCGKTLRVKDRVQHIVDDKSGRMLTIKKDCLILDGAVCSGTKSLGCLFCPREIYAYWRESWVERVDGVTKDSQAQ